MKFRGLLISCAVIMFSGNSHADQVFDQIYSYDAVGNMVSLQTYPSPGSPRPHAPVSRAGMPFNYDPNGNLLNGPGNSNFAYDEQNWLTRANGVETVYDANQGIVKTGSSTLFGQIYETDGTTITKYYYFGSHRLARRVAGVLNYYHADPLGSVHKMTDASGAVVLHQHFAPFGRKLDGTGADKFGLAGQRQIDATSGLLNMSARNMNPDLGIFTQPDPSGAPDPKNPQSLNRYAYANNSPVNLVDPTGFEAQAANDQTWNWADYATNALAGINNSLSFGLSSYIQRLAGLDAGVDYNSATFKGGELAGVAGGILMANPSAATSLFGSGARTSQLATEEQRVSALLSGREATVYHRVRSEADIPSIMEQGFRSPNNRLIDSSGATNYVTWFSTEAPTAASSDVLAVNISNLRIFDGRGASSMAKARDLISQGYDGVLNFTSSALANSKTELVIFRGQTLKNIRQLK